MNSLRTKMTIRIALLVLGSSILLSFFSYQRAKSSLTAQMENNYGVAAQKYALELTSWVSTNATIIDTMAAEIAVNDISLKGYDAFHNYLQHSNDLLNKNGYVYDVYFTYPNNYMVCASDFIADGTVDFVHEREWYTTSALTGELYYASPYLDSDSLKPVITISKAVYKEDRLLGVLAADIFVDVLVDMINNADVAQDSYAFLVDQNMRMIVHPNKAYDYTDIPKNIMDVPNAPYGALLRALNTDSDNMIFVRDYDGVSRGIAFSRMPNTGWFVCIATSRNELKKDVVSLLIGFVVATLISMAIGVVFSVFLARVLDKQSRQEQEYKEQVLKLEKQAADEASEAKSRFLAHMSHEIRTPLNAIIGMNEMILRETDEKDIQLYSRNIRQSGHNLLQLINGILDFSKIEDGKMEIVPVRYSVGAQISYYINSISDRAASKNLEMVYDIDPGLPSELHGDDTRINQVMINLLTNAVKYTEKGTVTLRIKVKEKTENEAVLYYEVKDTGIGIKESDMTKLFESFERLDVVRNRNIEGTGLGMTITRNLLELMGSRLNVESKYGEGSVFSFELRQKIENDAPLGDYRKALADISQEIYKESFCAPDAHILVVDDTKMNVFVVENLLKKTGLQIDSALNGHDAVRLAQENEYDIILMDQRMPGMDGTEAMKMIKASEDGKNRNTPIICLTADVIMGARDRYLEMGFDDYLVKPVNGTELEKMITKHLPENKYVLTTITENQQDTTGREFLKILKENGIDTEAGMAFSGNDPGIYRSVLSTYAEEEKEKSVNIQNSFDAEDWDHYGIYVHSLKSTSKTVGALKLYESAAELESAAKSGDLEYIKTHHEAVMNMYAETATVIIEHVGIGMHDILKDDEILEFEPEFEAETDTESKGQ